MVTASTSRRCTTASKAKNCSAKLWGAFCAPAVRSDHLEQVEQDQHWNRYADQPEKKRDHLNSPSWGWWRRFQPSGWTRFSLGPRFVVSGAIAIRAAWQRESEIHVSA